MTLQLTNTRTATLIHLFTIIWTVSFNIPLCNGAEIQLQKAVRTVYVPNGHFFSYLCSNCKQKNMVFSLPNWVSFNRSSGLLEGVPLSKDVGNFSLPGENRVFKVVPAEHSHSKSSSVLSGCKRRWPTFAVLVLDVDLSKHPASVRLKLLKKLNQVVKELRLDSFQLVDNVETFLQSHFILASGPGNTRGGRKSRGSLVAWQVGCGAIAPSHLQRLEQLEKASVTGELARTLGFNVDAWIVADEMHTADERDMSHARLRRQAIGGDERMPLDSMIWEGSGMDVTPKSTSTLPTSSGDHPITTLLSGSTPWTSSMSSTTPWSSSPSPTPADDASNTTTIPTSRGGIPKVYKPLKPIEVLFGTSISVTIDGRTFFDAEDGFTGKLRLQLYTTARNASAEAEENSEWIRFDAAKQTVHINPSKKHIGENKMTLCAFDSDDNEICEPLIVIVKLPPTIEKAVSLSIPAGRLTKIQMPLTWFSEMNVSNFSDLDIKATGDARFSWNSLGVMQVLSEAFESKVFVINLTVTDSAMQRMQLVLNLSVESLVRENLMSSNLYRLRLRDKGYTFADVEQLLQKIGSVLSETVSRGGVKSEDIIIVRLVQCQSFPAMKDDLDLLEFDWIYSPNQANISCSDVRLSKVVENFQQSKALFLPFQLQHIKEEAFGNCNDTGIDLDGLLTTTGSISTTSTTTTVMPTTTEKIIAPGSVINNFSVTTGLLFRKMIFVEEALNKRLVESLELYGEDGIKVEHGTWIGVSRDNSSSSVYGLALEQHFRQKPYQFRIKIIAQGHSPVVAPFSVEVQKGEWYAGRVANHNVRMRLRKHSSTVPIDELNRLQFRWDIAVALDKYLRGDCRPQCGMGIVIFDVLLQDSDFLVDWAQYSLLKPNVPGSGRCPWTQLQELNRHLLGDSGTGPQTLPQFDEAMKRAGVGKVMEVKLEKFGVCEHGGPPVVSPKDVKRVVKNITAYAGHPFIQEIDPSVAVEISKSIAFVALCDSVAGCLQSSSDGEGLEAGKWIHLKNNELYGLPLEREVQSKPYEFKIKIYLTEGQPILVPFRVEVRSNTSNPATASLNHRITLRIRRLRGSVTPSVLNALKLRWEVVKSLGSYLKSDCGSECGLDIVLLDLRGTDKIEEFVVDWAQKSVLLGSTVRRLRRSGVSGASCPWMKLKVLTQRLLGDSGGGLEPLPEFKQYLEAVCKVGKVMDVKLEPLGACASGTKGPPDPNKGPSRGPGGGQIELNENQKTFLLTTVVPACALIILALLVALMVACCLHHRKRSMAKRKSYEFQNKGVPVIFAEELEDRASPPSRPLILPNEKPPLPPPEYEEERIPLTTNPYANPPPDFLRGQLPMYPESGGYPGGPVSTFHRPPGDPGRTYTPS